MVFVYFDSMINKLLIVTSLFFVSASLQAETDLSRRIFQRYFKLRNELLKTGEKKDINKILPEAEYPLSDEEKLFVSKFILLRSPDPHYQIRFKDGVILWATQDKTLSVNLNEIGDRKVMIGNESIKLDVNLGDNFKTAFQRNASNIRTALAKEFIAQMTFKDVLLMAVVLPFSVLSSCGENQSSDADLLSLAGWTEIKTAESPNYLYAQDRADGNRAYLNAQTDSQAIKAGHTTNYYLNTFGKVASGQLIPAGSTVVVPKNKYSEDPNFISVLKQKLR